LVLAVADQLGGIRLVGGVGQSLEGEVGGRRAAAAEVDLDCVRPPRPFSVANGDEIDGEPSDRSLSGQSAAQLKCVAGDLEGIAGVSGEPAASERESVRPSEDLVMGREHLDLACRACAELHAWAAVLVASDPLLDDSTPFFEARQKLVAIGR